MGNAGYKTFSRNITRRLNNMLEKDRRAIEHIMLVEGERTRNDIVANIPFRTGELQNSVDLTSHDTEKGFVINVGITPTIHEPDNFTNTKLAGWLLNKPNRIPTYADKIHGRPISNSQAEMQYVVSSLNKLKYNVADAINTYWKSKQNNGGK